MAKFKLLLCIVFINVVLLSGTDAMWDWMFGGFPPFSPPATPFGNFRRNICRFVECGNDRVCQQRSCQSQNDNQGPNGRFPAPICAFCVVNSTTTTTTNAAPNTT
ncbi:hypothetical protein L9F63_006002 [Diploptera punctata]|uniref:Uncharacterized protein n=1 Tax=Diploptera punctata TaxID=6984 RepID=A0AAD7ZBF8_DIPPU|nr:hypothetical protein L9F63_006002 [Diploptera punctata]